MHNIIDTFTSCGEPCSYGCPLKETQKWIDSAHKMGTRKRVVAVQHWSWWDLEVTERLREEYRLWGVEPVLLYAENVLSDSSGHFKPGNWVRTSPLKYLHKEVLFETTNSLYVLVGTGNRKPVNATLILSLMP